MRESNIDTIRRGERSACVEELRAMAETANKQPHGITFEGGIDAQDAARILEAAARELERAFTVEAPPYKPDIAAIMSSTPED